MGDLLQEGGSGVEAYMMGIVLSYSLVAFHLSIHWIILRFCSSFHSPFPQYHPSYLYTAFPPSIFVAVQPTSSSLLLENIYIFLFRKGCVFKL